MPDTLKIILYSAAAGLPIIVGGLVSHIVLSFDFKLRDEINHWIVAFGGGALFSAITFALIPEGMDHFSILPMSGIFIGGTVLFMILDIIGYRVGGNVAQVLAMMMDFLPEALALGASFAFNHNFGLLLAIFIGLQNLPEGYNSYHDLRKSLSAPKTLFLMLGLSLVGIVAALGGEYFLGDHQEIVAGIMLFAGGGILYLIFQDIAPMSRRRHDWIPATGAAAGFLVGMIGQKFLG